ncbi:hypothetical protein COO60DRAFT_1464769 [Scenedesmus sp. NREL 46B-D3]|nr:hypothetical protein COO60DRAFT_1464769 [Scenedesmus sp. NREL 46B-D3]
MSKLPTVSSMGSMQKQNELHNTRTNAAGTVQTDPGRAGTWHPGAKEAPLLLQTSNLHDIVYMNHSNAAGLARQRQDLGQEDLDPTLDCPIIRRGHYGRTVFLATQRCCKCYSNSLSKKVGRVLQQPQQQLAFWAACADAEETRQTFEGDVDHSKQHSFITDDAFKCSLQWELARRGWEPPGGWGVPPGSSREDEVAAANRWQQEELQHMLLQHAGLTAPEAAELVTTCVALQRSLRELEMRGAAVAGQQAVDALAVIERPSALPGSLLSTPCSSSRSSSSAEVLDGFWLSCLAAAQINTDEAEHIDQDRDSLQQLLGDHHLPAKQWQALYQQGRGQLERVRGQLPALARLLQAAAKTLQVGETLATIRNTCSAIRQMQQQLSMRGGPAQGLGTAAAAAGLGLVAALGLWQVPPDAKGCSLDEECALWAADDSSDDGPGSSSGRGGSGRREDELLAAGRKTAKLLELHAVELGSEDVRRLIGVLRRMDMPQHASQSNGSSSAAGSGLPRGRVLRLMQECCTSRQAAREEVSCAAGATGSLGRGAVLRAFWGVLLVMKPSVAAALHCSSLPPACRSYEAFERAVLGWPPQPAADAEEQHQQQQDGDGSIERCSCGKPGHLYSFQLAQLGPPHDLQLDCDLVIHLMDAVQRDLMRMPESLRLLGLAEKTDELEADAAKLLQRRYARALQVSFCKSGTMSGLVRRLLLLQAVQQPVEWYFLAPGLHGAWKQQQHLDLACTVCTDHNSSSSSTHEQICHAWMPALLQAVLQPNVNIEIYDCSFCSGCRSKADEDELGSNISALLAAAGARGYSVNPSWHAVCADAACVARELQRLAQQGPPVVFLDDGVVAWVMTAVQGDLLRLPAEYRNLVSTEPDIWHAEGSIDSQAAVLLQRQYARALQVAFCTVSRACPACVACGLQSPDEPGLRLAAAAAPGPGTPACPGHGGSSSSSRQPGQVWLPQLLTVLLQHSYNVPVQDNAAALLQLKVVAAAGTAKAMQQQQRGTGGGFNTAGAAAAASATDARDRAAMAATAGSVLCCLAAPGCRVALSCWVLTWHACLVQQGGDYSSAHSRTRHSGMPPLSPRCAGTSTSWATSALSTFAADPQQLQLQLLGACLAALVDVGSVTTCSWSEAGQPGLAQMTALTPTILNTFAQSD